MLGRRNISLGTFFFFLPQYHLLNSLPALKIRININGEEVEQMTISSPLGNMRLNRMQMLTRREGEKGASSWSWTMWRPRLKEQAARVPVGGERAEAGAVV